jgi:anhydro-N-acetylmuramic acid kinase
MSFPVYSLGLMSGTSMDGVDAAVIYSDGESLAKPICSASYPYTDEVRIALKSLEWCVARASGDLRKAEASYLAELPGFFAERHNGEISYQEWLTSVRKQHPDFSASFQACLSLSIEAHCHAIQRVLETLAPHTKDSPSYIGYHGQTVYHAPHRAISVQLAAPGALFAKFGIPVVYDLRANDVANGGQGAPIAPVYHRAVMQRHGIHSAIMINCGGITNATIIGDDDLFIAYDAGPGNRLVDTYLQAFGIAMDADGAFGLAGQVNQEYLERLYAECFDQMPGAPYLERKPPRSLDAHDMRLPAGIEKLSREDACATLETFSALCLVDSFALLKDSGVTLPDQVYLSGGGWKNKKILLEFSEGYRKLLGKEATIERVSAIGLDEDCLEAELMAYLAVRSVRGLPITFPGTTGVGSPLTGGVLHAA